MCEVHAICPNCGNPELDDDEMSCTTVIDAGSRFEPAQRRTYVCRRCRAQITVSARAEAGEL